MSDRPSNVAIISSPNCARRVFGDAVSVCARERDAGRARAFTTKHRRRDGRPTATCLRYAVVRPDRCPSDIESPRARDSSCGRFSLYCYTRYRRLFWQIRTICCCPAPSSVCTLPCTIASCGCIATGRWAHRPCKAGVLFPLVGRGNAFASSTPVTARLLYTARFTTALCA